MRSSSCFAGPLRSSAGPGSPVAGRPSRLQQELRRGRRRRPNGDVRTHSHPAFIPAIPISVRSLKRTLDGRDLV